MDPNQTTPPIQQPVQPTPPLQPVVPPQPEPKGINWLLIFVGFIITAIIFGGAFFLGQNYNQQANITPTPTIAKLPSPTPTPDPTANWKTYTLPDKSTGGKCDGSAGYKINYPDNWSYTEATGTEGKFVGFQETVNNKTYLSINRINNLDNKTLDWWLLERRPEEKVIETEIKISGVNARQFTNEIAGIKTIYLAKSCYIFKIMADFPDDNSLEIKSILDQILSTFKFTPASPSASPSGSQTVCTQEVKLCPDGSSVGREGPNCEFKACPK